MRETVSMIINTPFTVKQFFDKKTGCYVLYCKKYEISSYGKTMKQAIEMFNTQVYILFEQTMPDRNIIQSA